MKKKMRFELSYGDHRKHRLSHVEGVSPIVIDHRSIILLHTQRPAAENVVRNAELLVQIQLHEHAHTGQNGLIIGQHHVVEFPGVQPNLMRLRYGNLADALQIFFARHDVVREHFEGNVLFRSQTNDVFVLTRIVNSQSTENSEGLTRTNCEQALC